MILLIMLDFIKCLICLKDKTKPNNEKLDVTSELFD